MPWSDVGEPVLAWLCRRQDHRAAEQGGQDQ